uniref:Uncharacterized protein n=1 Tax=Corynebacterium glutamicum TaxID=1718 RepID=Q45281_CORGT|nr:unnamed protein product [Corynebacterium glutamicum]
MILYMTFCLRHALARVTLEPSLTCGSLEVFTSISVLPRPDVVRGCAVRVCAGVVPVVLASAMVVN